MAAIAACKNKGGGEGGGSATPPAPANSGSGGSAATGSAATPVAAPAGPPLHASLAADAKGKPVLLALDDKNALIARTADGAFSRVIAPGPYTDGALDAKLDLVWLRADDGIYALDLRTAGPPARAVATPPKALDPLGAHMTGVPTWTMDDFVAFTIETPCSTASGVKLDWSADGQSDNPSYKGIKADKAWFAAHANRTKNADVARFEQAGTHPVPKGVGTCAGATEEPAKDLCGQSYPFGGLGADLVVVGVKPDACRAQRCQLFDPVAKKFSPLPGFDEDDEDAPTCGPFLFAPDGSAYVMANKVCDLKCQTVGKLALGWIDGNRVASAVQ